MTRIECLSGGRCGFAVGSELSGGIRNVTFRDSLLNGLRGIDVKPSVGRGGYLTDLTFSNITGPFVRFHVDDDPAAPLPDGDVFVPLVDGVAFDRTPAVPNASNFPGCLGVNGSACYHLTVDGVPLFPRATKPPSTYACKRTANTEFDGVIQLPWPVCVPLDAPVNVYPDYPNWGPLTGHFATLAACQRACVA